MQFLQGILYTTPEILMAGQVDVFHFCELLAESVDGGEYRFDVVFPANPPDVILFK